MIMTNVSREYLLGIKKEQENEDYAWTFCILKHSFSCYLDHTEEYQVK